MSRTHLGQRRRQYSRVSVDLVCQTHAQAPPGVDGRKMDALRLPLQLLAAERLAARRLEEVPDQRVAIKEHRVTVIERAGRAAAEQVVPDEGDLCLGQGNGG